MQKRWNRTFSQYMKQLIGTLLFIIEMCIGFTTDLIWTNAKVCSVTSKPPDRSSIRTSFLKDSLALLNIFNRNSP